MKYTESTLQQHCVKWFRYQYPQFKLNLIAIPNQGIRSRLNASRLKAEGMVAGVSDMLFLVAKNGFYGMCIEMKAGKNKLTQTQEDFKAAVEKQTYKHVTCYSFDEFQREITYYIHGKVIDK